MSKLLNDFKSSFKKKKNQQAEVKGAAAESTVSKIKSFSCDFLSTLSRVRKMTFPSSSFLKDEEDLISAVKDNDVDSAALAAVKRVLTETTDINCRDMVRPSVLCLIFLVLRGYEEL